MKNNIKLNLGCGNKYLDGYINCDFLSNVKTDKKVNLDKFPYPFKNNYANEILMDNVIEHLEDITKVMEELHRILKREGILRIYVPYGKSDWAMQDPTHKHFFTERSMNYFDSTFDYNYYSTAKFVVVKAKLFCETKTFISKLRNVMPFKNILKYYFYNIYDGIYFEMKAIK